MDDKYPVEKFGDIGPPAYASDCDSQPVADPQPAGEVGELLDKYSDELDKAYAQITSIRKALGDREMHEHDKQARIRSATGLIKTIYHNLKDKLPAIAAAISRLQGERDVLAQAACDNAERSAKIADKTEWIVAELCRLLASSCNDPDMNNPGCRKYDGWIEQLLKEIGVEHDEDTMLYEEVKDRSDALPGVCDALERCDVHGLHAELLTSTRALLAPTDAPEVK